MKSEREIRHNGKYEPQHHRKVFSGNGIKYILFEKERYYPTKDNAIPPNSIVWVDRTEVPGRIEVKLVEDSGYPSILKEIWGTRNPPLEGYPPRIVKEGTDEGTVRIEDPKSVSQGEEILKVVNPVPEENKIGYLVPENLQRRDFTMFEAIDGADLKYVQGVLYVGTAQVYPIVPIDIESAKVNLRAALNILNNH